MTYKITDVAGRDRRSDVKHALLRAAARRSLKADVPRDVLKANGTQVQDYLGLLREHRPTMTANAYAVAYAAVLQCRRATRQSVQDRVRELRNPVFVGGSDGR